MFVIKLNEYGTDLSGREFGKKVFKELSLKIGDKEASLDFLGVGSVGSSFADEVVAGLAKKQNNIIKIKGANRVVKSCLGEVRDDAEIEIIYED